MDEDAYDVIIAMTGSSELEQMKETYREEGGTINMCEAIRGMVEQGVEHESICGPHDGASQEFQNRRFIKSSQ